MKAHIILFVAMAVCSMAQAQNTFPAPQKDDDTTQITISELEEIVISSTRSTRTIDNIPTRMEFICGEELDEKGNMKP
ncbi:MAG: hypothetical protein LBN37_08125 [Bacteroidales bacterium]|jgi:iron complex outermembrane receptor protein|nr:hypothetical protein [Bacteroidales bacterium]